MNKQTSVSFISEKLKKDFNKLENSSEEKLFKFVQRAINDLKENPFCGIRIPRKLWPKIYIQKYNINSLRKYDLPGGWRLLYIIETDEIMIVSIILEWINHKDYEKRFGY